MSQDFELEQAIDEMLTTRFLQENTNFPTREAFFEAAGIPLHADDALLAAHLRSDEFAAFLSQNTVFDSFDALMARANEVWVSRSLFGQEVDMETTQEQSARGSRV